MLSKRKPKFSATEYSGRNIHFIFSDIEQKTVHIALKCENVSTFKKNILQ
jgi:hypothetical protein